MSQPMGNLIDIYFEFKPIIAGVISLIACLCITPLIIRLAHHKGWIVHPRNDRWHQKPTALMGGIGIFSAFLIAVLVTDTPQVYTSSLFSVIVLMFLTGLADDLWELKPVIKLLVQIICAFTLIYHGYTFGGGLLEWAGIPLTFIWVIGITNAINLLDNMDGLAAGISAIVSCVCGVLAILHGEQGFALMAFAITGTTIGFLFYNFKPARIFMGDSGSLFLGFSLSFLSISVQGKLGSSSAMLVLLVPISLMAIPIMDTTLVTIKRLAAGRRIDQGGRDHTSHRLVALGLSEEKTVLTLYGICAIWGVLCILIYKTQINNLFICTVLLAGLSFAFSFLLSKVKVYNESEEKLSYLRLRGQKIGNNLALRFFLLHKKLVVGVSADVLIVYFSFFIAKDAVHITLPNDYVVLAAFITVKIGLFYISRFYYSMWRYMEVVEVAGYFIFIFIATLILMAILFVKGKTNIYQPYFFLIDFLLTFTGIVFSRLFYRWVSDLISRNRISEKRVLIYGAGDSGYLLIKELLQNHKHNLKPVGWIDDDRSKHNMFLYGYKIHGGKEQLFAICKKLKPDIILISTDAIDEAVTNEIKPILADSNIQLGRFNLTVFYN
jgi:UDP-GlcNAc:undecaprenyl-phosphate GlcNAc-1-phosphate transferase